MKVRKYYTLLALFAVILTFVVVVYGAYTRITDSGLSCPDWPGCYGQLMVPEGEQAVQSANALFPTTPVDAPRAWNEMVHRYLAGTAGLLMVLLAGFGFYFRNILGKAPYRISVSMLCIIVLQILLGKWTVTMKLLPLVVSSHLIIGMTLLSLLWCVTLVASPCAKLRSVEAQQGLRPWAFIGLFLLIMQIASGGWTSTNMAGHVCAGFPVCEGYTLAQLDWMGAFSLTTALGHMHYMALMAVTTFHRMGGAIVGGYLGLLCFLVISMHDNKVMRTLAATVLLILFVQITLGFMNIPASRAIWAATAHNGVAALLLLSVIAFNAVLYLRPEEHLDE